MILCPNCGGPPRPGRGPADLLPVPLSARPAECGCGLLRVDSTMGWWLLVPKRCAMFLLDDKAFYKNHEDDERRPVRGEGHMRELIDEMVVWSVVDS